MKITCEKCRIEFDLPITIFGATMTAQAGINATCPNCAHINFVAPVTFEFDSKGDIIKAFLLNEDIPKDDLFRFIEVVKTYKEKNDTNVIAFKSEVAAINPKILQTLERFKITPDTIIQFLMLLILAYSTFIKEEPKDKQTINNFGNITSVSPDPRESKNLKNKKTNFQPKKKKRQKKRK